MEWIITCKVTGDEGYRVFDAFKEYSEIDWHKSVVTKNIVEGDVVYIYVGVPYSKIMIKTICTKSLVKGSDMIHDDSKFYNNLEKWGNVESSEYFRIKLVSMIDDERLSKTKLNELNLVKTNIQGSFKSENYPELFDYIHQVFEKSDDNRANVKQNTAKFENNKHYAFWKKFIKSVEKNELFNSSFKIGNTLDRNWINLSWYGPAHLVLKHTTKDRFFTVYISDNLSLFEYMMQNIQFIEDETKLKLEVYTDAIHNELRHRKFIIKYDDNDADDEKFIEWLINSSLTIKKCLDVVVYNFKNQNKEENLLMDDRLMHELQNDDFSQLERFEYDDSIKLKGIPVIANGIKSYPRNKQVAMNALNHAKYMCEYDNDHESFIRKNDGIRYTEAHHLVPMSQQDRFDVSLDVEENIVSLCSNCHNEIHYGKDAKRLIEKLYYERKDVLKRKGISITLKELLAFYE